MTALEALRIVLYYLDTDGALGVPPDHLDRAISALWALYVALSTAP